MKHSKKRAFRRAGRDRRGGQWGDGFRDRLRTAMAKAGLNQNQLAQRLGCGSGQVTGWLSRGLPGADYLSKIARACDVSADWLLGFDVPMERSKDLPRRAGPAIKATEVEEYLRARATELLLAEVDARELRARRQGLKRLGPPQTGKLPVSPHGGPYFLTNLALAAITGVAEAAGRPDTDWSERARAERARWDALRRLGDRAGLKAKSSLAADLGLHLAPRTLDEVLLYYWRHRP